MERMRMWEGGRKGEIEGEGKGIGGGKVRERGIGRGE